MVDMTTEYLGLKLANPLVPSASPLTGDRDSVMRLREAGASAIVLPSLFEEKIDQEEQQLDRFFHHQSIGFGEMDSFHPVPDDFKTCQDEYLEYLQQLKHELDIPVIASLNGTTAGGWLEYGKQLQQAGADALELNVYYIAGNGEESGSDVEQRYIDLLESLQQHVTIPITLKLSPQFSSPVHFITRLEQTGAAGVALFNRFYLPDIDPERLVVEPALQLSMPYESLMRIRWAALLHGRVNLSLAVTGGFHNARDAIKALLVGSDVVHLCSVLLQQGPEYLSVILGEMHQWLEEYEYDSVSQIKGSMSYHHAPDPGAYERVNYITVLDSYTSPRGVLR
ncbi:MAG: dihydroorotate dehydrogenase-like protein [Pseudomonadota bacterium]|nr:dihydroorotate dehydrogenase-like protein [Pseudomonadota bacterium]